MIEGGPPGASPKDATAGPTPTQSPHVRFRHYRADSGSGHPWNPSTSGGLVVDHFGVVRLFPVLDLATGPWPWPSGWRDLVDRGEQRLQELEAASGAVGERRDSALAAIAADEQRVREQATQVETRTKTLETLLDRISNAEVQTFFEQEATAYETEGSTLWKWGLGVLGAASALAILPIAAYYVGQIVQLGWFEDENLVAAHFAPAIALGAVAGVLLARARGRDRARQRARDLSVALGTMFVYTGQIADESERQRFVHEMGRTVIEAFLRQDSSGSEVSDGRGLLSAITQRP